jgi:hypothetical protein
MAMMTTAFGLIRQMQETFAAQQPAPQPQPQPQPQMPPPPPAHTDPGAMMAWMQQFLQMYQQMQPPQPAPQPAGRGRGEAQPQQMNPMAMGLMGMPPMTPPPGMIWVPGFGFVPFDRLAQAVGGGNGGGGGPTYGPNAGSGGPYRGPFRPSYGQQDDGGGHRYPPPQAPPPRQQTAAEQFHDALTVVKTAVQAVGEFNALVPQYGAPEAAPLPEDDDSPVQVIDTGPAKIVVNRKDGTLRGWETGWANADKILKWVGEQREAIQEASKERQQAQQQQRPQQLPPGYVEVGPDYQPPPGYTAVPVDRVPPQDGLPPPPAHMPPPIQATPAPNRTWDAPRMPGPERES